MRKLSFIILLIIFSCQENKHKRIIDFVQEIKISMNQDDLEELKYLSKDPLENNFLYFYYFEENILSSREGEHIRDYFKEIGINNNHDIINILFSVLQKELNEEVLDIDALIESAIENEAKLNPRSR